MPVVLNYNLWIFSYWISPKVMVSNWTKIFTVIAIAGKQSQPLRLLHFTSFNMANATQRLRNDIV
ncbi:MAG: hypothetical protein HEQ20_04610 [Aphanizomenon flos-aquae KM1D3_PB]|jgi:hypothetical protein|uniref:hypothetical protein n=1 Tax=Aphanizomenon flos-aquae TaxID=1176 RepID=UPI0013627AAA|nr:hypothetical protein [Aphanizomenon flos-aquae]MTJ31292.1 hypothetical protein [Aphanizomenon sp. UHCC 0183]QSV69347.1 MAG: hypothetical protein HEQ20_04610 [Aphanizomenon flos-aquae KM1D3_PB]